MLELIFALLLGVGLSAACGLRLAPPLIALAAASSAGIVQINPEFGWLTAQLTITLLIIAAVLEAGAYFLPKAEYILDGLASPASIIVGTLITSAVLVGMDPMLRWSVALVAGGGVAASVQAISVMFRAASNFSAGQSTPRSQSAAELGGSTLLSVVALAWPPIAAATVLIALALLGRRIVIGVDTSATPRRSTAG